MASPIRDTICYLLLKKPWYGTFAAMMRWRPEESCPTMGVSVNHDGTVLSAYNPKFIAKLTKNQLACCIQHEIDHVVRLHCIRRTSRIPTIWNYAADMVVNGDENHPNIVIDSKCHLHEAIKASMDVEAMRKAGFKIKDKDVNCVWYKGSEPNMTTEQLYDELKKKAPKIKVLICNGPPPDDLGEDGSGGSGSSDQEQDDKDEDGTGGKEQTVVVWIDDHGMWQRSTANEDQARQLVKRLTDQATQAAGNTPGHLEDEIKKLSEVRVDWRRKLNEFLGKTCGGRRQCFSRPNRRTDQFGVAGFTSRAMARLTLYVDTSGSIGQEEFAEFFAHIEKITWRTKATMVEFDHGIQHISKYRKGDWRNLKVHGRGGTSFVECFKGAEEKGLIGDVNIVFTDGYADWPEEKPYHVLWVIAHTSDVKPPWGEVIRMT